MVSIDSTILVLFMRVLGFNVSGGVQKPSKKQNLYFHSSHLKNAYTIIPIVALRTLGFHAYLPYE